VNRQRRYVYLLVGLAAYIVGAPLLDATAAGFDVVPDLLLPLCFAVGVFSLVASRRLTVAGGTLAALFLGLRMAALVFDRPVLNYLGDVAALTFCVLVGHAVLRDVLTSSGTIDMNRVHGAVCVYLLLGISWAILFGLVDRFPGEDSFRGLDGAPGTYLYFSFVTLTTLGYGDIVPLSPAARTLVALEATLGQLYLAILVAALVGRLGSVLHKH
jgi:hypothetical protein